MIKISHRFLPMIVLISIVATTLQSQQNDQNTNPATLDNKLDDLVTQIANQLNEQQELKIAIMPFIDERKEITEFAVSIVEPIAFRLDKTKRFKQVARGDALDNLLEEHGLWNEKFIDQSFKNMKNEKYRILGLDGFISGSISDWGNEIKLNCDLFSYKNGESIAKAEVTILKTATIRGKMSRIVQITTSSQPTPNVLPTSSSSKKVEVGNVYLDFSRKSPDIYDCEISNRNNFTVKVKVTKSAGTDYFGEPQFAPVFDTELGEGKISTKERLFLKNGDRIHIEVRGSNFFNQKSITL